MVDKKLIPVITRTKSYFRLNNWNKTICLHIKLREFICQPYLSIFNAIIGESLLGIQQPFNGFWAQNWMSGVLFDLPSWVWVRLKLSWVLARPLTELCENRFEFGVVMELPHSHLVARFVAKLQNWVYGVMAAKLEKSFYLTNLCISSKPMCILQYSCCWWMFLWINFDDCTPFCKPSSLLIIPELQANREGPPMEHEATYKTKRKSFGSFFG